MPTIIRAKEDMHNNGKCFTKGKEYTVPGNAYNERMLIDQATTNDFGERHLIGSFWRFFVIVKYIRE